MTPNVVGSSSHIVRELLNLELLKFSTLLCYIFLLRPPEATEATTEY